MSDAAEKSEQATPKRMKEVRSKGQLTRSQDLVAWLGVGAAAVMLSTTIARGTAAAESQMFGIRDIIATPNPEHALDELVQGLGSMLGTLGPLFVVVAAVVLLGAAAQGGIHFRKFTGRYEQLNLVKGAGRVFGMQALWEGAKSLLKTLVVGLVLFLVIQGLMPVLTSAGGLPVSALLAAAADGSAVLLQAAVAAGLVLAAADVFVVMKRNRKKTRMTKQELKDENKSSEGDPLIKSQRRSRQLAMSRNRMIASVAGSDVVLVNPTHIAVALRYEAGKAAPRVVAKGQGIIATRIREEADATRVPIVKDVPLARALHAECEIGHEIPLEHYNAVARVLAFVMALKKRGAAQGTHTLVPQNTSAQTSAQTSTQPPAAPRRALS
ncbi:flagellar biosynthetic protein FlhB [Microterricola gilva]|uniref:Flagellar biosynthetic protein FlhB n=1 Tax=Microterricola gilva TaxID=393267 RepID=A0A4Q8ANJ3_9MICO|nr:EscU/YscU/HrcU family type III secretion system export apparatus switch protein [Microterricola gilva]RZU65519.1 flagellar biosynthetic protein FlhB [Microterricola gilva]